jgi:energy-coupling factor transporter ATP-binding protein EcfA2
MTLGDKLDNILYGNVSFTAIVGDNGAGKSTFLDALQAWLVDFENNPGFVILEDGEELFYLSATECKLKIDESGMEMKKYKGTELPLPLNVAFFSDVFQSKAGIHEISKNSKGRNVRFYRDISTGGVINALSKEMRRYPLMREFQMNDSLLQIQLVEHFSTNKNEYPWNEVIGEKNLNFQAINGRFISQRIGLRGIYSRFHVADIPNKILRSIILAERYCHAKDIIRETLFFDYIDWIYRLARDIHSSSFIKETGQEDSLTIVLRIIDILFSEYWDENKEYSFFDNLFCGFNQENNENNENKIKEKFGLEKLEIPSFEVYVSLYYQFNVS